MKKSGRTSFSERPHCFVLALPYRQTNDCEVAICSKIIRIALFENTDSGIISDRLWVCFQSSCWFHGQQGNSHMGHWFWNTSSEYDIV